VKALARHAPREASEVLAQAMNDADPRVRKEAEKAQRGPKKGK
jgi:hypothetical protein